MKQVDQEKHKAHMKKKMPPDQGIEVPLVFNNLYFCQKFMNLSEKYTLVCAYINKKLTSILSNMFYIYRILNNSDWPIYINFISHRKVK